MQNHTGSSLNTLYIPSWHREIKYNITCSDVHVLMKQAWPENTTVDNYFTKFTIIISDLQIQKNEMKRVPFVVRNTQDCKISSSNLFLIYFKSLLLTSPATWNIKKMCLWNTDDLGVTASNDLKLRINISNIQNVCSKTSNRLFSTTTWWWWRCDLRRGLSIQGICHSSIHPLGHIQPEGIVVFASVFMSAS